MTSIVTQHNRLLTLTRKYEREFIYYYDVD